MASSLACGDGHGVRRPAQPRGTGYAARAYPHVRHQLAGDVSPGKHHRCTTVHRLIYNPLLRDLPSRFTPASNATAATTYFRLLTVTVILAGNACAGTGAGAMPATGGRCRGRSVAGAAARGRRLCLKNGGRAPYGLAGAEAARRLPHGATGTGKVRILLLITPM